MILIIPAQPATFNEVRQAVLFCCYKDGSILLKATDNKKPARFVLKKCDIFPWEQFLPKLIVNWKLSDYTNVPKEFIPQKRIPDFITENLLNEPINSQLKILATLRQKGYFLPLTQRKF